MELKKLVKGRLHINGTKVLNPHGVNATLFVDSRMKKNITIKT